MAEQEPLRGEVWDVHLSGIGVHPALVLSNNRANLRVGHVAVAVVTGTVGPASTHVPLAAGAGLTRYAESYVNITDLHAVSKGAPRRLRGRCSRSELARIGELASVYLAL
jgi:mRNA interferase MazF